MKPSLLIVKSRVKIDPTFENHVGYIDFSFANRQHKVFDGVYLKFFGSVAPRSSMTQSRTKLTNNISMNLVEYEGHDVSGFLECLGEIFNVVEG